MLDVLGLHSLKALRDSWPQSLIDSPCEGHSHQAAAAAAHQEHGIRAAAMADLLGRLLPLGQAREALSRLPAGEGDEAALASSLEEAELDRQLASLRDLAVSAHGAMLAHNFLSDPDPQLPLRKDPTESHKQKLAVGPAPGAPWALPETCSGQRG